MIRALLDKALQLWLVSVGAGGDIIQHRLDMKTFVERLDSNRFFSVIE